VSDEGRDERDEPLTLADWYANVYLSNHGTDD
jgi:hypothetical protein